MKVQVPSWRLLTPVYFCCFHFAGASFPVAAFLAVLIPSVVVEVSLNWKTAVAVLFAAACCQVATEPIAVMFGKMFRDQTRSRLGTLVYRSPLGEWFKLAQPRLEAQPRPQQGLVQVTRTSKAGDQFQVLEPLQLRNGSIPSDVPHVLLEPNKRYQTFLGFGGSFTESSADLFQQMTPEIQNKVLEAYFSKDKGLAYSWGRVHMGSCDFSQGNWSCVTEDDIDLNSFSIERYHTSILPMLRKAQMTAQQPLHLLASPWSPPAWMKDTKKMLNGGSLLPEFRDLWAKHFVLFARAFDSQGLRLWGFTVQNEPRAVTPWENCLYTAEEERDFVRDHLGPALASSGLDLKLLIWDHNRDGMFLRAHTIYSDPEAAKYVWGTGYHWYGDLRYEFWPALEGMLLFDNVRKVHELWPEKHLIMTESCQESGPRIGDWKLGERYAEAIIQDLENWLEAWIDWNLILDETGGPNHVQNLVSAPVIYDTARKELVFLSSFYYIGHFSRYILPGAQRIAVGINRDSLKATGFRNPDGDLVVIVLNPEDYATTFWLKLHGKSTETEAPARSIATYRFHSDDVDR